MANESSALHRLTTASNDWWCTSAEPTAGRRRQQAATIFNLQEKAAIEADIALNEHVTTQKVKDALRRRNLKLRCTLLQLHSYVARENAKRERSTVSKETTVAELHMTVHEWTGTATAIRRRQKHGPARGGHPHSERNTCLRAVDNKGHARHPHTRPRPPPCASARRQAPHLRQPLQHPLNWDFATARPRKSDDPQTNAFRAHTDAELHDDHVAIVASNDRRRIRRQRKPSATDFAGPRHAALQDRFEVAGAPATQGLRVGSGTKPAANVSTESTHE